MKQILFSTMLASWLCGATFGGSVYDADTKKPITGAIVNDSRVVVNSAQDGTFAMDTEDGVLHARAYGYRPFAFKKDFKASRVFLKPIEVKALYLNFWRANLDSRAAQNILNIIDKTGANAIVVDVKNEYGSTSYKTAFEQANDYGAYKKRTIKDVDKFLTTLHLRGIYVIARVVVFKDELQALHNPSYAIKTKSGDFSRDRDGMAWVDPFNQKSHEYTLAIAEDAARVGFDEVCFDYIRFPAKQSIVVSRPNNEQTRVEAIESFLFLAKNRLKKYGVFTSVSIYGNVFWQKDDTGIGQKVESLAKYADYIAPMLYPSGFVSGSFGVKYPADYPYMTIYKSIKNIEGRIKPNRIRPWLQAFKDYAHSKRYYKKFEIQEQIRGAKDANASGWMMWSPSSNYNLSDYSN